MEQIIALTLAVSGGAVVIAAVLAIPLACLISLSRFKGRDLLVLAVYTGFALPPVVVGLLVYLILSRGGPLGSLELLFTPAAMVISQCLIALPYILGLSLAAIEAVPADVVLQARALGASKTRAVFTRLKEAKFGVLASVFAGFGAAISEVGSVVMVGGNIAEETRVLTGAVMLETRRGNFDAAILMGAILLAIVFSINALLLVLSKRSFLSGFRRSG